MSEIEKMYILYKIKKRQNCSHSDTCYDGSLDECEGCNSYQYPPFASEKQLELIKWYISSVWWLNLKALDFYINMNLSFEEKLAKLTNQLWEDMTENQRKQIRDILESEARE